MEARHKSTANLRGVKPRITDIVAITEALLVLWRGQPLDYQLPLVKNPKLEYRILPGFEREKASRRD